MWMALLTGLGALSVAQAGEPGAGRVMLAAQLAVTAEPFEDGGTTVSLNVFPLIAEWAATERVGVRANTVLNLQFAGAGTGLSHRGGGLGMPVYLARDRSRAFTQGLVLGPYVGVTTNPLVDGWDLTLAADGGYRFAVGERGVFNIAGQLGGSRLERPSGPRWVNHLGVFPSVGLWF